MREHCQQKKREKKHHDRCRRPSGNARGFLASTKKKEGGRFEAEGGRGKSGEEKQSNCYGHLIQGEKRTMILLSCVSHHGSKKKEKKWSTDQPTREGKRLLKTSNS